MSFDTFPKEWEVVRLGEVISLFHNGTWGEDPIQHEISYPVIRSTEITHDGKIDLSTVAFRKIADANVDKYALKDGDILLVASSGSSNLIGRAAFFKPPGDGKVYLFSNFMIRIRPKNIAKEYLFYYLSSLMYHQFLKALQQTSTGLRNLPKKEFLEFKLPLPPLPEQRRIAEVLGTVDSAIQKVGGAIERTERLKRGLMQRLLTRGIGRERFKFSKELGCKIPEEWEAVRFKEIIIGTPKNGLYKNKQSYGVGFKMVHMTELFGGDILKINEMRRVSASETELANYSLNSGDLLFARRSLKIEGSGRCVLVQEINEPILFESSIILTRPDKEKAYPLFYLYYLNSLGRKQILKMTRTVAVSGITGKDLQNIFIPLPPLPEQRRIAEILGAADWKLELERRRKEKLERVKKGLMNELLTGRKRVKVKSEMG